jgi:hypothetical protein
MSIGEDSIPALGARMNGRHVELVHVPDPQECPQPPQSAELDVVSTHPVEQRVNPAHAPLLHFTPLGHGIAHDPQLEVSVCVLVQVPLQLVSLAGQAHFAFWHVMPPEQVYCDPQPPQSVGLVLSFTHEPLHSVRPAPVH